jgi:hypothetical protein
MYRCTTAGCKCFNPNEQAESFENDKCISCDHARGYHAPSGKQQKHKIYNKSI